VSEANIEIVRAIYGAWERGDSVRGLVDDDLEYVNPPYAVESGIRRGRDALARVRDVYPDFHVRPERFIDLGEDVVVPSSITGTSVSGVEVNTRQTYVWTIRDGRAVRFCWFNELDEALADAGTDGSTDEPA
jgi:ketosteroid isomerase-like protein